MDSAIRQPHAGDSLAFAPAAGPLDSSQAGDFANSRPRGEGLNVGYFALNLEVHRRIVSSSCDTVNGAGPTPGSGAAGQDLFPGVRQKWPNFLAYTENTAI